jgi:hypothetical protein
MAKHRTLNGAMAAGNLLAEAEIRYKLLAEAFEEMPQLRSNLNAQLERAKAEITQLRAMGDTAKPTVEESGRVVAFDADRFRKSG